MSEIESCLELPLGISLAEGNWENHVYELGDSWVYKEIKSPESLDSTIQNYVERKLLQEFWNSEIHFKNMQKDHEVFKTKLGTLVPKTLFCRHASLLNQLHLVTISVQEKLKGILLKNSDSPNLGLQDIARSVRELCEQVFLAPADFHLGNLLVTDSEKIYFFDTGTPSDWEYFLDADKFMNVVHTSPECALSLVNFMRPVYEKHWQKLFECCE